MTRKRKVWTTLVIVAAICFGLLNSSPVFAQKKLWVMCYFPGWELGDGTTNSNPPLSAINFSDMTAVAYFGFDPQSDGTIDTSFANYSGALALAAAAHAKGAKVILSVGGWNTESGFAGATDQANLAAFVGNIIALVKEYGFDGVDLDWESYSGSISSQYSQNFENLSQSLRAALDQLGPGMLLTTTGTGGDQSLMTASQQNFDQINLMTYDLSAEYGGWPTWYNSAIYSDGDSLDGEPLPNVNSMVRSFERAGVDSSKIGIGCEFAGTVWEGASLPDVLPVSVSLSTSSDVPLYASDNSGIMQKYYSKDYYHWDPVAQVGYLSIPAGLLGGLLGAPAYFVTYDDSNSIAAKFNYIKQNHLGGMIIYELGWGYPPTSRSYPLLEAVKANSVDTNTTAVHPKNSGIPSVPLLAQNYPNPFNPTTLIAYSVAAPTHVDLSVYDVLGRRVETLVNRDESPGNYSVIFNGGGMSSGVYFYRLRTSAGFTRTRKMVLVK